MADGVSEYEVTYTTQLTQKTKKFKDGRLRVGERRATLLDENGSELYSWSPASAIEPGRIETERFLIDLDEPVAPSAPRASSTPVISVGFRRPGGGLARGTRLSRPPSQSPFFPAQPALPSPVVPVRSLTLHQVPIRPVVQPNQPRAPTGALRSTAQLLALLKGGDEPAPAVEPPPNPSESTQSLSLCEVFAQYSASVAAPPPDERPLLSIRPPMDPPRPRHEAPARKPVYDEDIDDEDETSRHKQRRKMMAFKMRKGRYRRGDDDGDDDDDGDRPRRKSAASLPTPHSASCTAALFFPSLGSPMVRASARPQRTAAIPTTFASVAAYRDCFSAAVAELLQVALAQSAITLYSTLGLDGGNVGQPLNSEHERTCRMRGVALHVDSTLARCREKWVKGIVYHATIKRKMHTSNYAKDDLWALAPTATMVDAVLARSSFFGPDSNGRVELKPLTGSDQQWATLERMSSIIALRVADASSEFLMLDTLDTDIANSPIMSYIATGVITPLRAQPTSIASQVMSTAHTIADTHSLNTHQRDVLFNVARGLAQTNGPHHPVLLVHGVFGAGKSMLVATIVLFLHRVAKLIDKDMKVALASVTNVAIDRVLMCLLDMGFEQFVRVGSIRRIARPVLPFVAGSKQSNNDEEIKEIQQLLRSDNLPPGDIPYLKSALDRLRSQRSRALITAAFLIATTFASTNSRSLDDVTCRYLLLDECSQAVEPMSVVPAVRFKPTGIVAVGDPLQLPPTLPGGEKGGESGVKGLERTLFERLDEAGASVQKLMIQYRCHPDIAQLSNTLFYNGQIEHGVQANDRPPAVTNLPALSFVDIHQGQERKQGDSFCNFDEARAVVMIIEALRKNGISDDRVGVISLYRAQTKVISDQLSAQSASFPQVSTVDAFQGAERDVIIISCVRSRAGQNDFVDSARRVNVAISRAKRHLILVACGHAIETSATWRRVMGLMREKGALYNGDVLVDVLDTWRPNEVVEEEMSAVGSFSYDAPSSDFEQNST